MSCVYVWRLLLLLLLLTNLSMPLCHDDRLLRYSVQQVCHINVGHATVPKILLVWWLFLCTSSQMDLHSHVCHSAVSTLYVQPADML